MMRVWRLALVVALGVTALLEPTTASADTTDARRPENRADLQCMAIFAYISGSSADDANVQAGAVGALMFYWGRLKGRAPTVDWLDELKKFIVSDLDERFKVEGDRCGAEMSEIGEEMTDWGQAMQVLAGKMEPGKQHRLP